MINLFDFKNNYKSLFAINKNLATKNDLIETNTKIKELLPKILKNSTIIQLIDENQFLQMVNLLDSVSKELQQEKNTTEANKLIDQISEVKNSLLFSRAEEPRADERKIKIGLNMCFFSDIDCEDYNGSITSRMILALEQKVPFVTSRAMFRGTAQTNEKMFETTNKIENILLNDEKNWVIFEGKNPELLLFLPKSILIQGSNEEQLKALDFNPENLKNISIEETLREPRGSVKAPDFMEIFSEDPKIEKTFSFFGHGDESTVAAIDGDNWKKILSFLDLQKCRALTIQSCYSGGKSSLMTLPLLSKNDKFGWEESQSSHPYLILARCIGDFTSRSGYKAEDNLKNYLTELTQFLEGNTGQTLAQLKKVILRAENGHTKGLTNANRVHFPSPKGVSVGFSPLNEIQNEKIYTLTGLEIKKNRLYDKAQIYITKQEYLLLQPSNVTLPLSYKENAPLIISMIPGEAHHVLKQVNLPNSNPDESVEPDEYLEKIIKFHVSNTLGNNKCFFIGDLHGTFIHYKEVALYIDSESRRFSAEGMYTYRRGDKYYFKKIGKQREEITAIQHAILISQFESLTKPSEEALKYGSSGQEEPMEVEKALRSSIFYSDTHSKSKLIIKEIDTLKKNCSLENLESCIQKLSMTKRDIEEIIFLLLTRGYGDLALKLIEKRSLDSNMKNFRSTPLIVLAAVNKENSIVGHLLKTNADPNAKNRHGETALHYAIRQQNENLMNELLKNPKIDVAIPTSKGFLPITEALRLGKKDIISLLKQKGSRIDGSLKYDDDWLPVFTYFVKVGNRAAVEFLLEEKVDPYHGKPSAIIQAIYQNDLQLVKKMIEIYGPPPADDEGHEPLIEAALRSTPEILKLLLDVCKNDINKMNKEMNPLLAAYYSGTEEKIEMLKKEGAALPSDLRSCNWELLKQIILGLFLSGKSKQLLDLLLEFRNVAKDPILFERDVSILVKEKPLILKHLLTNNVFNHPEEFLFHMGRYIFSWDDKGKKQYIQFMEIFLNHFPKLDVAKVFKGDEILKEILQKNNLDLIKLAFKNPANLNMPWNQEGTVTPFAYLASCCSKEVILWALDQGALVNPPNPNNLSTPLQAAAVNKIDSEKEGFKLLSKRDGTGNMGGSNSPLPLVSIIETGRLDHVEWCLKNGFEVNKHPINPKQLTPLQAAIKMTTNPHILEFLLASGADLFDPGTNGKLPIAELLNAGDPKFVEVYFEKMGVIKTDEFFKQSLLCAIRSGKTNLLDRLLATSYQFPIEQVVQESLVEGYLSGGIPMLERLLLLKSKETIISDSCLKSLWNAINRKKDIKAAAILLDNKISSFLSDGTPTAEESSLDWDNFNILKLLVDDYNVKLICDVSKLGFNRQRVADKEYLPFFLAHGLDPNSDISLAWNDKDIESILNRVISTSEFESVKLLLEAGAQVNCSDSKKVSPLYKAVETNNLEIIKLLLEKGANIHAKCMGKDGKESSPFELAGEMNSPEILALFF